MRVIADLRINRDKENMILGLIPARGGSKGLVGKNVRKLNGRPLITYAIRCAQKCSWIDKIVVSTDDKSIARIAQKSGADVPFIRPHRLAQDGTPMGPVIRHALEECEKYYHSRMECIVLLDPTAPLRTANDVKKGYHLFVENACDAVISGNESHRNPWFNMVRKQGQYIRICNQSTMAMGSRQKSPKTFDLNTVVWIYSRKAIMGKLGRIPKKSILHIVSRQSSLDIDTLEDFQYAEYLLKKSGKS